eukprot:c2739_g1_i1.p2 GENE.c2739_g1_i1~~c2739_g1_i1.p2  ORF type:complete len:114 (+),score=32.46 c2739_g1_i1:318-659(+)
MQDAPITPICTVAEGALNLLQPENRDLSQNLEPTQPPPKLDCDFGQPMVLVVPAVRQTTVLVAVSKAVELVRNEMMADLRAAKQDAEMARVRVKELENRWMEQMRGAAASDKD